METVWIVLTLLALLHTVTGSILNVAHQKPASASSMVRGYNASTAVDGNTDGAGYGTNQIIHTSVNQNFAWWKVDLKREVQNATVKIYFRTDYRLRRNGVELYTSSSDFTSYPGTVNQLCNTVTGKKDGSDIADVYNVTCPGTWRYLLIYTNTSNSYLGPGLDFGEVEVYACSSETYGESCTNSCSSRNCITMSTTCARDGRCPDGCQSGWKGADCTQECESGTYGDGCSSFCTDRNCSDPSSECNHLNGQCEGGCRAGYQGTDCKQGCNPGTYGENCIQSCTQRNCNQQSSECDTRTGQCVDGCQVGWTGVDCTSPCDFGVNYGVNCIKSCTDRQCNQSSSECDTRTGQCIGGCQPGWTGVDCTCLCMTGCYGPGCTEKCGGCDGVCDSVDGRCLAGCLDGYSGTKCDVVPTGEEHGNFGVGELVGSVVGTFILVVLLCVGIIICLIRQGRLQWTKSSKDRKQVQELRHHMSSIAPRPAEAAEHSQSSNHDYNNDYSVLDSGTKTDNKDYDIIKTNHYQNL